jgi:hypothetical protein
MSFTPASAPSLAAFLAVLALVATCLVAGIHHASRRLGGPAGKRAALAALGLAAWLGLTAIPVASGALEAQPVPRAMIFLLACNLGGLVLGLSRVGGWLAAGLPLGALVAFQGFRLPLELVLHSWGGQGTIPMTMTWEGSNLDVITGIVSLALAWPASRSRAAAWAANLVGIALLANVARVAIMSSPFPFAWGVEPPLQLAFHLPYAWIVPVCVAGALAGHVVLTRALLRPQGS